MADNDIHHDAMDVALVCCSGILGDVIRRNLAAVPDVAVVADVPFDGVTELAEALCRSDPDVVVWVLDDERAIAEHAELFHTGRGRSVIAVLDDGRSTACWQLRPHRTVLDPPSIDNIVAALRDAAAPLMPDQP
ncbi:hypothetical protein A5784_20945 [Mycobacterium sp. 852013-50091_SCH5140682]|uniref:hypothetical protein n=1 Tax=Mycobacterium sp. 852013-50091_SCH5140682 TaxID=1834109 RepID=UPI0007EAD29C|nr:hypothetical protein [Mycobacterium sp. 852013-50091_SCH5140682]OBC00008.1 hypothetical protein A5784_20945 [Mycobacterium sp. 852013-50091_SCH5140682]